MRKLTRLLALLLCAVAVLSCVPAVGAQAAGDAADTKTIGLDLMLVVDDTKSMRSNDQNGAVAKSALQTFIDKIPSEGSRVGIATYDQAIMQEQEMIQVDGDREKQILKEFAKDKVTQDGSFTDLPSALRFAVHQLQGLPPSIWKQGIIAISDGENDFVDAVAKAQSDSALLEVVQSKIPVYLIVINPEGDQAFIDYAQSIADATGGLMKRVSSGDEVQGALDEFVHDLYVYEEVDDQLLDQEVGAPIEWKIPLSDGIFEANLELVSSSELDLELRGPDGSSIPLDGSSGALRTSVMDAEGCKTNVKLLEPVEGAYTLVVSSPDVKQHVLGIVTLNKEIYIKTDPVSSTQVHTGDKLQVSAQLMHGSELYTDVAVAQLDATLTLSDGTTLQMQPTQDGFICELSAPARAGDYRFTVNIQGKSFQRSSDPVELKVEVPPVTNSTGGLGSNTTNKVTNIAGPGIVKPPEEEEEEGGFPWWIVAVAGGLVVLIVVLLLVLKTKPHGGDEHFRLQGTLTVTYYQPGRIFTWEKYVQPGSYYSKRAPCAPLGRMLRDLQDFGEVPPFFDQIQVGGVHQPRTGQQYVEIKGQLPGDGGAMDVDLRLHIDTGMLQEDEFDNFEQAGIETIYFPDGSLAEFSFTLG